jgi:hypothetical protein
MASTLLTMILAATSMVALLMLDLALAARRSG